MSTRRGIRDPVRQAIPTDSAQQVAQHILDAAQSPIARQLAEWVKSAMTGGYGLKQSEAIRTADGKMPRDQRLYDAELIGASHILSQETRFNDFNSWVLLFNNNMGWRRVDYIACRYGFALDPVTRGCVPADQVGPAEVIEPEPLKIDDKAPLPINDKEKKPFEMTLIMWIGVGIVAAVILSGLGGRR